MIPCEDRVVLTWNDCNAPYNVQEIHVVAKELIPPNVHNNFTSALLLIIVIIFVDKVNLCFG